MKLSILAVALFAAILGKASPLPQDTIEGSEYSDTANEIKERDTLAGSICPPGLKVNGFARIADYTIWNHEFDGADLAQRYADGLFDNFGGPIIARALALSDDALPSKSEVFVQAQTANYFWHKKGSVADLIGGLTPNTEYATYVKGGCSQFTGPVLAKCCY